MWSPLNLTNINSHWGHRHLHPSPAEPNSSENVGLLQERILRMGGSNSKDIEDNLNIFIFYFIFSSLHTVFYTLAGVKYSLYLYFILSLIYTNNNNKIEVYIRLEMCYVSSAESCEKEVARNRNGGNRMQNIRRHVTLEENSIWIQFMDLNELRNKCEGVVVAHI